MYREMNFHLSATPKQVNGNAARVCCMGYCGVAVILFETKVLDKTQMRYSMRYRSSSVCLEL